MGQVKKKMFNKVKRKNKSKNKKLSTNGLSSPRENNTNKNDSYDIEASDDEMQETPPKWYDEFPRTKLPKTNLYVTEIEALRNEAELVLDEETKSYKSYLLKNKKSETNWMMTVAKSGTSSDKVAALALMIQESPVHNLSMISTLVNMARVSKKHQFVVVLETLTELFTSDLLRPNKKLKKFSKQPLSHLSDLCENDNTLRRKLLCFWLFEDKLKNIYEQFIKLLNDAAHDSVQNNREKAIGSMLKVLLRNREQEKTLITNLVNKLGDPVHKVASRVVYGLEKIPQKYTKMKTIILDEIERMLFRPHISKRAQYYGICFLSQYRLSGADRELCKRLIALYFSFFKACVKTGDIDSRLMGALLVGVNRAYPYASRKKNDPSVIPSEHIDTMFKVVHFAPFKISLQALALLLQISNTDRFYNALYKKLLDKELMQTSHQAIWLNLVLKALRKDTNTNRKKSFIKRILQICLYFPVPLICGTLIMLSQVLKYVTDILDNFKFPEEVKEETCSGDVISNIKRFEEDDDEEEEERYFDVKTDDDPARPENIASKDLVPPVASSWYHRDLQTSKSFTFEPEKKYEPPTDYDSLHRNPAFAGGEKAIFSELIALTKHFHPTVSLFANKLLLGEKIHYTGDPLKDFTLLHFVERFSFKNPKKPKPDRGEDKEELFRAVGSQRSHYIPVGMRALPVQSDLYLNQTESAIPVDELFLYKYLKKKQTKKEKGKRGDDISDTESVGSVEFNEYLDNLTVGKKTKKLDFAEDIEITRKNKKRKGRDNEEENDDEDEEVEDSIDEMNDESGNEASVEEGEDDYDDEQDDEVSIEDFDEEVDDLNISESEEDEEETKLSLQNALKKRINRDFGSLAVPAEKFSQMLEEAGRVKSGGSHDLVVTDNASQKQLKWETSKVKQDWKMKSTKWKNKNKNWKTKKSKKVT